MPLHQLQLIDSSLPKPFVVFVDCGPRLENRIDVAFHGSEEEAKELKTYLSQSSKYHSFFFHLLAETGLRVSASNALHILKKIESQKAYFYINKNFLSAPKLSAFILATLIEHSAECVCCLQKKKSAPTNDAAAQEAEIKLPENIVGKYCNTLKPYKEILKPAEEVAAAASPSPPIFNSPAYKQFEQKFIEDRFRKVFGSEDEVIRLLRFFYSEENEDYVYKVLITKLYENLCSQGIESLDTKIVEGLIFSARLESKRDVDVFLAAFHSLYLSELQKKCNAQLAKAKITYNDSLKTFIDLNVVRAHELRAQIKTIEAKLQEKDLNQTALASELSTIKEKLTIAEREKARLVKNIVELKDKIRCDEQALQQALKPQVKLERAIQQATQRAEAAHNESQATERRLHIIQTELSAANQEIVKQEKLVKSTEKELEALKNRLDAVEHQCEQQQDKIQLLENTSLQKTAEAQALQETIRAQAEQLVTKDNQLEAARKESIRMQELHAQQQQDAIKKITELEEMLRRSQEKVEADKIAKQRSDAAAENKEPKKQEFHFIYPSGDFVLEATNIKTYVLNSEYISGPVQVIIKRILQANFRVLMFGSAVYAYIDGNSHFNDIDLQTNATKEEIEALFNGDDHLKPYGNDCNTTFIYEIPNTKLKIDISIRKEDQNSNAAFFEKNASGRGFIANALAIEFQLDEEESELDQNLTLWDFYHGKALQQYEARLLTLICNSENPLNTLYSNPKLLLRTAYNVGTEWKLEEKTLHLVKNYCSAIRQSQREPFANLSPRQLLEASVKILLLDDIGRDKSVKFLKENHLFDDIFKQIQVAFASIAIASVGREITTQQFCDWLKRCQIRVKTSELAAKGLFFYPPPHVVQTAALMQRSLLAPR